jgi:putative glutamine amidotransferase
MIRIGITQRVDMIQSYGESRDALDQNWFRFLDACNIIAVPIPNALDNPVKYAEDIGLKGLLLTGGNDITQLPNPNNASIERDQTEQKLLNWASQKKYPVIGICRGMQYMAYLSGEELNPIHGHVATRHPLLFEGDSAQGETIEVNSFHNWGLKSLKANTVWEVEARTLDGSIESIIHKTKKQRGIMWHPEREQDFSPRDIELIQKHFSL